LDSSASSAVLGRVDKNRSEKTKNGWKRCGIRRGKKAGVLMKLSSNLSAY
jgi:hypothetical protein